MKRSEIDRHEAWVALRSLGILLLWPLAAGVIALLIGVFCAYVWWTLTAAFG